MPHIAHDEATAVDDPRAAIDQLAEATIAALRAPSILDTQPWRWTLVNDTAELWIDRDRVLTHLDPEGRLLVLSCGLALDHAVTALHAGGHTADVVRFGDDSRPDLVATVKRGHVVESGERTVQPRDLSGDRPAGLLADATHDAGTTYLILFADTDEPHDWLRAGEALSDMWLTLTAQGLAASPISEVIEVDATRVDLRRLLGDVGYPMVALRAGTPIEEQARPPASPRRPASDVIELLR